MRKDVPANLQKLVQAGIGSVVGGYVMRARLGNRPCPLLIPAVTMMMIIIMARRPGTVIITIVVAVVAACGQND
jgi:hypothetical protein